MMIEVMEGIIGWGRVAEGYMVYKWSENGKYYQSRSTEIDGESKQHNRIVWYEDIYEDKDDMNFKKRKKIDKHHG